MSLVNPRPARHKAEVANAKTKLDDLVAGIKTDNTHKNSDYKLHDYKYNSQEGERQKRLASQVFSRPSKVVLEVSIHKLN